MAEPLTPRESVLLRIQQLEEELRTMKEVLALMEAAERKPTPLNTIRTFDFHGMKAIQAMVEYLKAKGSEASLEELYEAMKRGGYDRFNPKTSPERQRRSLVITATAPGNKGRIQYDEERRMFSLAKK